MNVGGLTTEGDLFADVTDRIQELDRERNIRLTPVHGKN